MDAHDLSPSDRLSKLVMAAFTGVAAYLLRPKSVHLGLRPR